MSTSAGRQSPAPWGWHPSSSTRSPWTCSKTSCPVRWPKNRSATPGELPLRDHYLPDLASVLDLRGRLCAGGVLALCAIPRPDDPFRGDADYALLVQERSGQVLNATRRLAVIPKGFHEPLRDVAADARIGATLRRGGGE